MNPETVERMGIDQVYTLAWNRKRLQKHTGDRITGTASELAAMGSLPEGYQRGGSVAQDLMARARKKRELAEKAANGSRKAARALRRIEKQIEEENKASGYVPAGE